MRQEREYFDQVRYSHAGHDFHFTWAARQALQLLRPGNELCAISIEGVSPLEPRPDGAGSGLLIVDLAEYHGDERPDLADKIKYIQLKYATTEPRKEWTIAALSEKEKGKPQGIIAAFSRLFNEKIHEWGYEVCRAKLVMELVTNRPISPIVLQAFQAIAEGQDFNTLSKRIAPAVERIRTAAQLDGKNLALFASTLVLHGEVGSRYSEERSLEMEINDLLPGPDITVSARLREMVRAKALPEAAQDPVIRRTTVLGALGIADERDLLPCPPLFDDASDTFEREQEASIVKAILDHKGHTLVHAEGGTGKSVLARRLVHHLPDHSVSIVFDGFAGGAYLDQRHPRHRHDRGIVQIINELAFQGLCEPIIPQTGRSADQYLRVFDLRIKQAVSTLRSNRPHAVLLIVLDAADNSQFAADASGYKERCFVQGLLSGDLVVGCRVVALCRTERRHLLSLTDNVQQLALTPFTQAETAALVHRHFPQASASSISEFHRLTSANPRVQANEIKEGAGVFSEILSRLGPNPKTVNEAINQQLERSLRTIREHGFLEHAIERLCVALAVLPPRVPIGILEEVCEVTANQIRSFCTDFGRPIWLQDDAVQFRDEPTDTWFRQQFSDRSEIVISICNILERAGHECAYAQSALPRLLYSAARRDELIALTLSMETFEGLTDFEVRRIILQRVEYALKAALDLQRMGDVVKLLLLAGEYLSRSARQDSFIAHNAEIFGSLYDPLAVQELVFSRPAHAWTGRAHARSAAILALHPQFASEASSFLRQAGMWLHEWMQQPKERRAQQPIEDNDIANIVVSVLFLHGPAHAVDELSGWHPEETSFMVARRIAARLIECDKADVLCECFTAATENMLLRLGLLSETTADIGILKTEDLISAANTLLAMEQEGEFHIPPNRSSLWLGILSLAEHLARQREMDLALHLMDTFVPPVPDYVPGRPIQRENDEHLLLLRHGCLRASLRSEPFDINYIIPSKLRQKSENDRTRLDRREKVLDTILSALLPIYQLRADFLTGRCHGQDAKKDLASKMRSLRSQEWEWHRNWDLNDLPKLIAEGWLQTLLMGSCADPESANGIMHWLGDSKRNAPLLIWTGLARLASGSSTLHEQCLLFAGKAKSIIDESHLDATSAAESYLDLARAVQRASPDDAKEYLDLAVRSLGRLGDESRTRLETLKGLADRACDYAGYRPQLAYAFARVVEVIGTEYASHKFPWHDMCGTIGRICPSSAFAITSRWRERRVAPAGDLLPDLVCELLERKLLSPGLAMALRVLGGPFSEWPAERFARCMFTQEVDTSIRDNFAHTLVRDFDYDSGYWRQASQLAGIFKEHGLDSAYLADRAKAGKNAEHCRDFSSDRSWRDGTREDRPCDWNAILNSADFIKPHDIAAAIERYRATEPPFDWPQFYARMNDSVAPGNRLAYLEALLSTPDLEVFQIAECISNAREKWRSSPSVSRHLPVLLGRYARENAGIILFQCESCSLLFDINRLLKLAPELKRTILEYFVRAASDQIELCDAERMFCLARICMDETSCAEAFEALGYGLGRFASVLKDRDGNGEWRDALAPPENLHDSIAGHMHAALANPQAAERWRAVHSVLRLCQYGEESVLAYLMARVKLRCAGSFVDSDLPFYDFHARLYVLIALARAAKEHPGIVKSLLQHIKDIAPDELPHVLLRHYKAAIFLEVERQIPGTLTIDQIQRLNDINKSPFPQQNPSERPGSQKAGWCHRVQRTADNFIFSHDFDRYWIDLPCEMFALTIDDFEDRASTWIKTLYGSRPEATGHWEDDNRHKRNIFNEGETWHSHSSYPRTDDLCFYLSYHSMFCTVGELLATKPVIRDRLSGNDPFGYWLGRHLLTRRDGRWLFDRRDLTPLAPETWPEDIERSQWRWSVTSADLEAALRDPSDIESLNVFGHWSLSDGSRREDVRISSALVSPRTSLALLRALQTAMDLYEFRIPDAGDEMEIRKPGFKIAGWVEDPHRELGLDEFDPFTGSVGYPELRPSKAIRRRMKLEARDDFREWHVTGCVSGPVMRSWMWGNKEDERGYRASSCGQRLTVRIDFLSDLLKSVKRDLILEVKIERSGDEEKDYRLDKPYWKILVVKDDGRVFGLYGRAEIRATSGSGIAA